MAKGIYSLLLLCICLLNNAQSLHFDNYTTKDGLVSDEVYKLFQDKKGYIWLFTNYGAMKYNGKTFEPVLKNLPFNESFIYSYYENDKGQIWVANSNAKIYEVKNDSAFIVKGTKGISEKLRKAVCEISDIYVNHKRDIYITTKLGTYKLDNSKGYEHNYISRNMEEDSVFVSLLYFGDKIISSINNDYKTGVITGDFLFYIDYTNDKGRIICFKNKIKVKSNLFKPMYFNQFRKDIYFLFNNNVIKIKPDQSIKYVSTPTFILNYTKDKNDHLWIGTLNDGLYELDENDSIINHYLIGKTINHVLIDSQNGLWASSDGSGLFHCKNLNEIHYNKNELYGDRINFLKKIGDRLFLANSLGDIFIVKNNHVKSIKSKYKTKSDVLDIIKYKSGFIICYRQQMEFIEVEPRINSIKLPSISPAFYPLKLSNIKQDTILCVSRNKILFLNNGISSLRNKNVIIYLDHKILSYELRNKNLLFATDDGVYQFINNQLVMPKYLESTKSSIITKIVNDQRGNYWFCSKGSGLFKLNQKNEVIHYTYLQGLPSSIVNDISFKEDHHILLSTNKGLFINANSNNSIGKWTQLYSEEVKSAVSFNKSIYLATNNGLVIIKENKTTDKNTIYFNLATIMINGITTNQHMLQSLSYDQNNISFLVDVISYSTPIPDVYYLMEGSKKQEGTISTQHLSFSNLEPGKYTLTLKLASKEYQISPIVIQFTIIPAFWQTLWFKLLLVFVFLLLCFLIAWQFLNYFKSREKRKNETTKLITEYKLIALKAQINPHFMSNCLTAIQHLILTNKVNEANQYLAKFSLLVRQVLNFSSKSLVTLDDELDITQLNIELEQLRFEHKFVFEIHYNDNLNLKTILIPPLLIQPITENAIWHGLLPLKKTRKGLLLIKINIVNELLHIVIEDNGMGRKTKKVDIGNIQESKGILITKQRIQNLNVYYHTNKADLIYEDLVDSGLNPSGTRVTIILPLNLTIK